MLQVKRSERVNRLRDRLINTEPIVCAERAVIWTEVYKRNEDKSPILKAALALAETLRKMSIQIYDDELIVGNQGSALRATTISPTVNPWVINELDRFEQRDGSRFRISEEAKEQIRRITPYWQGRNVYDNTMAMLDQNVMEAMDALVFTCGYTLGKGCGHWLLNFETVLLIGFKGIQEAAQAKLDVLDYTDPEGFEKIPLYRSIVITCEAVKDFAQRYSTLAGQLAQTQANPTRKAELEKIARVCARVPYEAPQSFHEALQTVYFIQLITQIESDGTGISLGRMDYYLDSFYRKDRMEGTIDQAQAAELLDCMWLKIASIIQIWNEEDSKAFGGHPISQAVTLGGMDAQGNDATNELSYLMLETTARVHMPQPSVCVRISRNTPDRFLAKSIEVIREGLGMPALFNDEIAIPSMVSRGIPIDEAREYYGIIGCVEMGVQGRDCAFANSGYFNLVKALEITLNNGIDPVSSKKLGIETGDPTTFERFDQFYDAYVRQMQYLLSMQVAVTNVVDAMHARILPLPFVTAITDDCIETGKEVQSGGARYNFEGVQGVGLADIADSLAAIKKLVFEERKLTIQQLLDAINADYQGYEAIQTMLLKDVPAYGNNEPYVDQIARKITRDFCDYIGRQKNLRGGSFIPGMYSNSANVPLGAVCGASPNGRFAYAPVAEACSPGHGKEKNGPTQAALSVASLDHMLMTNGSQYNQKFHPSALEGETGINALADLVRTYFEAGGYHVQFNVVSSDTLREAQHQPDQHKDLVVRVAGYTAFFIDLNREIQNDIIDRTQLGFEE